MIEDRLGVRRGDTFGLRCEVRWMEIASPTTGEVLRIEAVTPVALHMSTTHFTADDLFVARNEAELTHREELIVHLDVAHRGLGVGTLSHARHLQRVDGTRRPRGVDIDFGGDPTIEWLSAGDPSVRWQVMRDLLGRPEDQVAVERARVATEELCTVRSGHRRRTPCCCWNDSAWNGVMLGRWRGVGSCGRVRAGMAVA